MNSILFLYVLMALFVVSLWLINKLMIKIYSRIKPANKILAFILNGFSLCLFIAYFVGGLYFLFAYFPVVHLEFG